MSTATALSSSTPFSRLLGKPPIMVAGMTPSTVQAGFVSAVLDAGFHVELSGGGQYNPAALRARVAEIQAKIPAGVGLPLNALYINPRQFGFQLLLWQEMRKEEIIGGLRAVGIRQVAFKPGSVDGIRQVVAIAASNPDFPVIMQWTGGRAGGHHSCEDFPQPIGNFNVEGQQYVCAGELVALQTMTNVLNYLKLTETFTVEKVIEMLGDIVKECFERAQEQQKAEGHIKLERGYATIPLPGIDVPFHSRYLWAGVLPFRAYQRLPAPHPEPHRHPLRPDQGLRANQYDQISSPRLDNILKKWGQENWASDEQRQPSIVVFAFQYHAVLDLCSLKVKHVALEEDPQVVRLMELHKWLQTIRERQTAQQWRAASRMHSQTEEIQDLTKTNMVLLGNLAVANAQIRGLMAQIHQLEERKCNCFYPIVLYQTSRFELMRRVPAAPECTELYFNSQQLRRGHREGLLDDANLYQVDIHEDLKGKLNVHIASSVQQRISELEKSAMAPEADDSDPNARHCRLMSVRTVSVQLLLKFELIVPAEWKPTTYTGRQRLRVLEDKHLKGDLTTSPVALVDLAHPEELMRMHSALCLKKLFS
uniref:Fatty acid synthase n=1 Tax=Mycena chlorophos TaxID=658473 RepID=A0ABQ0LGS0_MYCCL|nr:fatty acid synthase [Mycena chlorophos]